MKKDKELKVALVHEFLPNPGGAEKVLETLCEMFPSADIYTLIYQPENYKDSIISKHNIKTSFLQKLPYGNKIYRNLLPFMPIAIEQFDLRDYDLIISCHYCVSHGILTYPNQKHIVYCCTPIKQVWSGYFEYLNDSLLSNPIKRFLSRIFMHYFRIWDSTAARRVQHFVSISSEIQQRIKLYYSQDSEVIYPPVNISQFHPSKEKDNYYFAISRLSSVKRFDLIVEAFKTLKDKTVLIAGTGPEYEKLLDMSKGYENIKLLGRIPEAEKIEYLSKAKALVFPTHEDFGIVTVEAQASGTPVICYGKGGALDTVKNNLTGLYFNEQSASSLIEAISQFETLHFTTQDCTENAKLFSKEQFKTSLNSYISNI